MLHCREALGRKVIRDPGSANLEAWVFFLLNVQLEDEDFLAVEEKATGVLSRILLLELISRL